MSATSGPDIVSDSLVFYYDTGNSRDSYKGEPTVNIRASTGLDGSYASSGRTIDNSGTLTAPDGSTGWSSISSPGSDSDFRIAKFTYNTLTEGLTYTFSLELYNPGPNSLEIFLDGNAGQTGTTIPLGYSRWSFTYTVTRPNGGTWAIFFGAENKVANATYSPERLIYFKNYQVEQKTHATPFTTGTRSATQGLLDISGQGTSIDLSNVSFDSNAQMTFDGTDDYIDLEDNSLFDFDNGIMTVEAIITLPSSWTAGSQYPNIISKGASAGWDTDGWALFGFRDWPSAGQKSWGLGIRNGATNRIVYIADRATDVYLHVVAVLDGSIMRLYENGVQVNTNTQTINPANNSTSVRIGRDPNSNYFPGEIPHTRVYNRALTAAEVKQNYDSIKTRFGLI